MRIAVTGGNGKLGRHVVARLTEAGHEVIVLDVAGTRSHTFIRTDLTDYGQVVDALAGVRAEKGRDRGYDAVVHLAAHPAPGVAPDIEVFRNNMVGSFDVYHAALRLGIRKTSSPVARPCWDCRSTCRRTTCRSTRTARDPSRCTPWSRLSKRTWPAIYAAGTPTCR